MHLSHVRPLSLIAIAWFACGEAFSQTVVKPSATPSKIEPGLELAVNWKWWVTPPEKKEWGMPLPDTLLPEMPSASALEPRASTAEHTETYEVVKGDTLGKIAKKFDMTTAQLKRFNELKTDLIRVGQVLRIPTPEQLLTLAQPPPEPKKEVTVKKKPGKPGKPVMAPEPDLDPGGEAKIELENVLLQVFLDREMFSPGVIDGKSGPTFQKICQIYQNAHKDAAHPGLLKGKAEAALKQPYTRYTLRADDFKFIKPSKIEPVAARRSGDASSAKKKTSNTKGSKAGSTEPPPVTMLDEWVKADFLAYTSAWEFVAERFHCDEAFLHRINPQLKAAPDVGAEFQVPNVIPFEIETALVPPLQPAADPQKPVSAAVVTLSRLEISCDGKLIAVMPLASARPGLRGRGSWTVLDAIPQPRMATRREPREIPKEMPASSGEVIPGAMPVTDPPLVNEQYLAPGPNNPVGIIWLNLAKVGSKDPLPYGLHGTSIPSRMSTLQGIGGFRLSNWDIARATRLLPAGTPLQWKAR